MMGRVYESVLIDAPAADVWELLRDFTALGEWCPDVVSCEIEDKGSAKDANTVRVVRLNSGIKSREQLADLLEEEMRIRFVRLSPSEHTLLGSKAQICVVPITSTNQSVVIWEENVSVAEIGAEAVKKICATYLARMKNLNFVMKGNRLNLYRLTGSFVR